VPAPLEKAHVQQRRVGHLQEADPVARHPGQHGAVVAAGEHVERVDGERDGRVVRTPDGVPRLPGAVDPAAPGQRLEGDRDAVLRRQVADPVELLGGEVEVGGGVRAGVGAGEGGAGAEVRHHRELRAQAVQHGREPLGRHALDVPQRLEEVDREPEIGAAGRDLARRQRGRDEVVVEDLDAVEARCRDRLELSRQDAADGHGGDALPHHPRLGTRRSHGQAVAAGLPRHAATAWSCHPAGAVSPRRLGLPAAIAASPSRP
jgi:hypothetical protein